MAHIWLWNSIATRKRAPSDDFLENGLTTLKGYLETRGHKARVIDWQKNEFYDSLCPGWLLSLNRLSTMVILALGRRSKLLARLYFPVFNLLQDAVSFARRRRMRRRLWALAREAVEKGVKIFGVKVWYGEAFVWADLLSRYLKRLDPSILTIGGGFHVTLYEDDFLRYSYFDLGVISGGERTMDIILKTADSLSGGSDKAAFIFELMKKIESGGLKNIVYRDGEKIKVTGRYAPVMEEKTPPKYDKGTFEGKLKVHLVLDSLGCPWGRCSFCVHQHFYRRFYPRPVESVIAEMESMLKMGVGLFKLAGSETPPPFGRQIAGAIMARKLKLKFSIGSRAISGIGASGERYDKTVGDYEVMLRAGLLGIFMGGETGNDVINDKVMNKGVKREDLINTARAFKQAQENTGIKAYLGLALIYPTPLADGVTTREVFDDDISLVEEMAPDSVIVTPCTPFKHSAWFNEKEKYGFDIPVDFIERMMKYEYVLYKPPDFWPPFADIRIHNMGFKEALDRCGRLRAAIESKGISTDFTDEFFLMLEGAGYEGKEGIKRFKKETSIDLISSDYRNLNMLQEKINAFSAKIAASNGR